VHAHAPACTLDPGLSQYWSSYLENAALEPASAICFLDPTALDLRGQSSSVGCAVFLVASELHRGRQ